MFNKHDLKVLSFACELPSITNNTNKKKIEKNQSSDLTPKEGKRPPKKGKGFVELRHINLTCRCGVCQIWGS